MLSLETYDENDVQGLITDYEKLKWSSHYGESGSGFGYLKFSIQREVGSDYRDIGYGYRVILRKYLKTILFDGQIRKINEVSSPDGDRIEITCLGQVVIASDDEILRAFCDKRLNQWVVESEVQRGSLTPNHYTFGSNNLGLYIHANNNQVMTTGDYVDIEYEFFEGEVAERLKCDLSLLLGSGVLFDGQVDAIDAGNGYVDYKNDSGEGSIGSPMVLYNYTKEQEAVISAVDTGTNRITVTVPSAITTWAADDEITVYGPKFSAQITDISSAVITYGGTISGEGNLANGLSVSNLSKKGVATISSYDDGANTITVTDEDHLTGWEEDDIIVIGAPLFEATFSSNSTVTITYSAAVGERIVSNDAGWVLHNVTEDEYATVDSWNIGSSEVIVTDVGDITGNWTNGDTLRIYYPFYVTIYDSNDAQLWPASGWRSGAVPHDRTAIDVTTSGSPTKFVLRMTCYVTGTANEYTFAGFTNLRVYSTTEDVDVTMLAKYVVSILSAAGHDLSDSEDEIEVIAKTLEPMVFEFDSPAEALSWACQYGDGSSNLLAWGVRMNDDKTLFVETQDKSTISYVIRRTSPTQISMSGDIQGSVQQVRAIYADKLGDRAITAWQSDTDAYFSGHYRRVSVKVDNVDTDEEAVELAQLYLSERKVPKRAARYTASMGAVFTPQGISIPVDEIKATGDIILIEDWRSVESGLSGTDLRDNFTKEQLVGVEIDYDQGSAQLIPAGAKQEFMRYMAELSRMTER